MIVVDHLNQQTMKARRNLNKLRMKLSSKLQPNPSCFSSPNPHQRSLKVTNSLAKPLSKHRSVFSTVSAAQTRIDTISVYRLSSDRLIALSFFVWNSIFLAKERSVGESFVDSC
jgi:hypothetical protein